MEYKDALGQDIKPGQVIAYPTASSTPTMKISVVDELTEVVIYGKTYPAVKVMGLHQKFKRKPEYHWEEDTYFSRVTTHTTRLHIWKSNSIGEDQPKTRRRCSL